MVVSREKPLLPVSHSRQKMRDDPCTKRWVGMHLVLLSGQKLGKESLPKGH